MNTLKFQKRNIIATEQHNLEIESTKTINVFGNQYTISVPCNLNIIVTNSCPCNCFFCINHQTININGKEKTINYIPSLQYVLKELNPNDFEITITGGEPTISSNLIPILELCHKYGFKCRTFSTTAFQLDDPTLLKAMIDNNFIHNINVSRLAIDQELNNKLFQANPNSWNKIKQLATFFKCNNAEMRLSCNLIKGVVENMNDILTYVNHAEQFDVDSIIFRELVENLPSNEIKEKQILLENILDISNFQYMETLSSNYYKVDVYTYKNYIVKHYTDTHKTSNTINSMSFMNGVLRKGFVGEKIFEYGK